MRVAVLAAALCLSVGLAVAGDAEASMKKHTDIPAQALGTALKALAKDRGIQLVFRSEVVGTIKTHGATGELTTREALTKLLEGTDLVYSFLDENTVTIVPKGEVAPGSAAGPADPGRGGSSSQTTTQNQEKDDSFRVAQVDQGPPATSSTVKKEDEEEAKKKPEQLQEVVVTGTHIHGSTNPTAPLIVIDRAEIESSGFTTTQQLVDSIPQNFRGGAAGGTEDGLYGSGFLANQNDSFATAVNLRGLGESSTLVLVNGHRMAPSAQGIFVDVSMIPLAAIDRVEIMTDGASAIYGADAVAGVVNFILRKDYQGQETWANYGSGTDGTRPQSLIGQSVGRNWSDGNAVATLQYQKQGALSAADRSYTSSSPSPTDLYPESRRLSALASIRQDLPAGFDIAADLLYSHAHRSGAQNPGFGYLVAYDPVSQDGVATVTLGYRPSEQWRVQASASYGLENTAVSQEYIPQEIPVCGSGPCHSHDNDKIESGELIADGSLFRVPGGDVKAALGVSYRNETFSLVQVEETGNQNFDRHVTAEFMELELPIVGAVNALPGVRRADISLAVRHDDYSDFGSTTNPRFGVSWQPVDGLHVRAAYSTAFRAPNAYEETAGMGFPPFNNYLLTVPLTSPTGATVPIFYQRYLPGIALNAEKSRNVTAGFDLEPTFLSNFKLSVDYFNIRYRDRVITPNLDAAALSELNAYGSLIQPIPNDAAAQSYLNNILAEGGQYFDEVGTGAAGVRYLFNGYEQNAALERTSGVDVTASFHFSVSSNEFRTALNVTRINSLSTSYTNTSTPTDLSNTYGNPLHWRGRGQVGWSRGRWSFNAAANYSGSYVDTSTASHPPIASWTTVDAQIAYALPFAKESSLSISCTNLTNKDPPYVLAANQFVGTIHYDVANANPLGRVLLLSARVAW